MYQIKLLFYKVNKNMCLAIIGNGFVGNSLFQLLSQKNKVKIFDIDITKSNCTFIELIDSDFIFLCLPTPSKNKKCDISLIQNTILKLKKLNYQGIVVIKSTVPPGTTEKMSCIYNNILFNPEFLREKHALFDTLNPERIFIAGKNADKLKEIYLSFFSPDIIFTEDNPTNFEMVKYMSNTFLATKVALANEFFNLAENLELEYSKLKNYLVLDSRINSSHLNVPGHSGKLGYGGNCFIKDTEAFIDTFSKQKVPCPILKSITKYAQQ